MMGRLMVLCMNALRTTRNLLMRGEGSHLHNEEKSGKNADSIRHANMPAKVTTG